MRPSEIEMAATKSLWRDQFRALPRSLRYVLRRLARREPRMYLIDDASGTVLARFTSYDDHLRFMAWLNETSNWSFQMGRENRVAQYLTQAHSVDGTPCPEGYPGCACRSRD